MFLPRQPRSESGDKSIRWEWIVDSNEFNRMQSKTNVVIKAGHHGIETRTEAPTYGAQRSEGEGPGPKKEILQWQKAGSAHRSVHIH